MWPLQQEPQTIHCTVLAKYVLSLNEVSAGHHDRFDRQQHWITLLNDA